MSGKANLMGGAELKVIGGDLIVSGTLTDWGFLELDAGGTISGGGSLNVPGEMSWNGGTLYGLGTTNISGQLFISSSSGVTLNQRNLFNDGTIYWVGGDINVIGGANIHNNYNGFGGTFLVACTACLSSSDNTGSFSNYLGTFVAREGSGRTDIFVPFSDRRGITIAESGTITFNGNLDNFLGHVSFQGGTVNF
jgi:hypothetical protein